MDEQEKNSKVSWNTSEGLIMEINNLRNRANSLFISGDIRNSFKSLVSIKNSVIQSLSKEERDSLEVKEKQFFSSSVGISFKHTLNKKDIEIFTLSATLCNRLYSDYNEMLQDILERRGYLISETKDISRMKF